MICEDQILYLDNHLLVLDKPGGIPTQPPPDGAPGISLEEQGKDYLKKKFNKPGNVFLQAVHRIDKAVSGVVIFARTSKALSRMGEQMRAGQISKIYLALVEGKATGQGIKLEDWLLHCERRARICTQMTKDAKLSQLVYDVMQQTGNFSLLKIHLLVCMTEAIFLPMMNIFRFLIILNLKV